MHSKVNAVMCEVANPVVYVLGEFDVRNVKNAQSGEQLEVISRSQKCLSFEDVKLISVSNISQL